VFIEVQNPFVLNQLLFNMEVIKLQQVFFSNGYQGRNQGGLRELKPPPPPSQVKVEKK